MRAAIIAGGEATRFGGRPKGLEPVGGVRILDRVVDACVAAFGSQPLLIANDPEASGWYPGLRVVPDRRPGFGSLGGLYTAVVESPAPVVAVAWDMPFLRPGLLAELAAGLEGHDVFLPASRGVRGVEPLCAAYGTGAAAAIAAGLDAGDLRAVGFHDRVKVGILSLERVARHGDPALLFFNVNTTQDLIAAGELWRQHGSSESSGGRAPERPR